MRSLIAQVTVIALAAMAGAGIAVLQITPVDSTLRSDMLGFAGNMIGPGAGGLVGYLLVIAQERRADGRKVDQIRRLLNLIERSLTRLLATGRGNNDGAEAQVALEQFRRDVAIVTIVTQNFSVINLETLAALQDFARSIDDVDWDRMETQARHADTFRMHDASGRPEKRDDSMFQTLANVLEPHVARVRRSLT